MNKTELIAAVAEKTDLTKKQAESAVNAVIESVVATLKAGDKVQLVGFGTFDVKAHAARTARNPRTGEAIQIEATKKPGFTAGKALKDAVNE